MFLVWKLSQINRELLVLLVKLLFKVKKKREREGKKREGEKNKKKLIYFLIFFSFIGEYLTKEGKEYCRKCSESQHNMGGLQVCFVLLVLLDFFS